MKTIAILAVGIAVCLASHAQTAKVIALSDADAAKVKSLYDQRADIDKQINDMHEQIRVKYTIRATHFSCGSAIQTHESAKFCSLQTNIYGTGTAQETIDGWWVGFEYSDDFKFIVPTTYKPTPLNGTCPWFQFDGLSVGSANQIDTNLSAR